MVDLWGRLCELRSDRQLELYLRRGQAVAIIIFMLGLGMLLPWNFFITASQVPHLHPL